MEDTRRREHTRWQRPSTSPDAGSVPDEGESEPASDAAESSGHEVNDTRRQEWAWPASDIAAKRLANRQRLLDDLAATFDRQTTSVTQSSPVAEVPPPPVQEPPRSFILDHLFGLTLGLCMVVSLLTVVGTLSARGELISNDRHQPAHSAVPDNETQQQPAALRNTATQMESAHDTTIQRANQIGRWWEARFGGGTAGEGVQTCDPPPSLREGLYRR